MSEAGGVRRLKAGSSPHIAASLTARGIMAWVLAALAPSLLWALWNMGTPALLVAAGSLTGAVGTEFAWNAIAKKRHTLGDLTAVLTGVLLAMTLPPYTPWWMAFAGGVVAIGLGKMLFGGLGWNLFNPALVGRAMIVISWAGVLALQPNGGWFRTLGMEGVGELDAVSGATPLGLAAADRAAAGGYGFQTSSLYGDLLFRNLSGSIGEISAALLIAGGLVLVAVRIIDWRIPAGYVGTMAVLSAAFGGDPVFHMLAGGLMIGAFYMATDYVSSPMSPNARLLFGVGCGVFNALGRFFGSMPEATTFAILFMNGLAPMLDRAFVPRTYGWVSRSE
ncbi:MAG: RnfABCDGE type electron transport complex subunit D [Coriobacteriia bacterium]|nr:RnfABCDGE type electron transport complex subunit D [Coriobacteriia bacterium]